MKGDKLGTVSRIPAGRPPQPGSRGAAGARGSKEAERKGSGEARRSPRCSPDPGGGRGQAGRGFPASRVPAPLARASGGASAKGAPGSRGAETFDAKSLLRRVGKQSKPLRRNREQSPREHRAGSGADGPASEEARSPDRDRRGA
ncbi:collagen alpha-1(I) chain-like [Elephas maximus indicus]|uniref:collagen alpha-1(I) chain-like n=1 Tax=Elephas maximus indicus TaxID=99487 RepID=UPI0021167D8F|nr:collagen alpha-1(I) chain-like [Elephas maximus indicus]